MPTWRSIHGPVPNSRASRARAARARCAAAAGCVYTSRIAAARARESSDGTSSASSADTTSGTPPTAVVTTGTPAAIASNRTTGVPSVRELKTQRSNAGNRRPASGTTPCHRTRSPTFCCSARASSHSLCTPVPTNEIASRTSRSSGSASTRTSGPFSWLSRPTHPTTNSSTGRPSSRRAAVRSSGGLSRGYAFGTTCRRSRAPLQVFIEPVAPRTTGEPVRRRHRRNAQLARDTSVYDVRPIAVRVNDVGPQAPAQLGDCCALARVAAARYDDLMSLDARGGQRREQGIGDDGMRDDAGDVNLVARFLEPGAEELDHALEAAELRRRDHVQDQHFSTPSRITTAAAKPS